MTKKPEDMTSEERKKIKVEFAPGAFDTFDGSQEELDELVSFIQTKVADGSFFEDSRTVDLEELFESDDPADQALAEQLLNALDKGVDDDRNLQ